MNESFHSLTYEDNTRTSSSFSPLLVGLALSVAYAHAQANHATMDHPSYIPSEIHSASYSETKMNMEFHSKQISEEEIYNIAMAINDLYQNLAHAQVSLGVELEEAIYDELWELYGE